MQTSACTCAAAPVFTWGFLINMLTTQNAFFVAAPTRVNNGMSSCHCAMSGCMQGLRYNSIRASMGRYPLPTTPRIVLMLFLFTSVGPRPLGLEPSWILGTILLVQWLGHSCVRCLGSVGHSSLCCQSSFHSSVPAACEPAGWKIGVHGNVV